MATERLPMRKIREVLRLRWQLRLTVREAARSLGVSLGVVSKMGARAASRRSARVPIRFISTRSFDGPG
jgi:DNA-directed RNA polymerase specialized sigma subunit